jgi:hypothetical protein
MSHFSRIKTQFRNREVLTACLTEMGFIVESDIAISGYRGLVNVDLRARNSAGHDIGFIKNADGSFDMVGDWSVKGGYKEQNLARQLQDQAGKIQQEYARRIVLEETGKEGFSIVREVEDEDGTIRIVVRRWVS